MEKLWATEKLVPGIKVRMTSIELCDHLKGRAAYHRRRRDEKQAELPKLKEAVTAIKAQPPAVAVSNFSKGGSYRFDGDDAVEQLEADIKQHNDKSVAFDFLAEHLFEQDYCLERGDLAALEILK